MAAFVDIPPAATMYVVVVNDVNTDATNNGTYTSSGDGAWIVWGDQSVVDSEPALLPALFDPDNWFSWFELPEPKELEAVPETGPIRTGNDKGRRRYPVGEDNREGVDS